jgi:hypothetical protein
MSKLTKKLTQKLLLAALLGPLFTITFLQDVAANDLSIMHLAQVRNNLWYEGVNGSPIQVFPQIAADLTAETSKEAATDKQAKVIPEELLKAVIYFQAKQL